MRAPLNNEDGLPPNQVEYKIRRFVNDYLQPPKVTRKYEIAQRRFAEIRADLPRLVARDAHELMRALEVHWQVREAAALLGRKDQGRRCGRRPYRDAFGRGLAGTRQSCPCVGTAQGHRRSRGARRAALPSGEQSPQGCCHGARRDRRRQCAAVFGARGRGCRSRGARDRPPFPPTHFIRQRPVAEHQSPAEQRPMRFNPHLTLPRITQAGFRSDCKSSGQNMRRTCAACRPRLRESAAFCAFEGTGLKIAVRAMRRSVLAEPPSEKR